MKTTLLTAFCIVLCLPGHAQQISSLDLLLHPEEFTGAITGMGGGDLREFSLQSGNLSAQGAIEMAFGMHSSKRKAHIVTYPIIFRYNLLTVNKLVRTDAFNVQSLAFVENFQTVNLGIRARNLGGFGDDKFMHGPFLDGSYSRFVSEDSTGGIGFGSYVGSLGYQIALLKETDMGPFGISLSGQGNYLTVMDEQPGSFRTALNSATPVASQFAGGSLKATVQFNDFSFFMDLKRYFPLGPGDGVSRFTDRAIFSFGGAATGALAKLKKKGGGYSSGSRYRPSHR